MSQNELEFLWSTYMHRFLAEGVHYRDLLDMKQQINSIGDWSPTWTRWAEDAESRADEALNGGHTQTAASEYARSSIYFFFSQFLLWDEPENKYQTYSNCVRTFRRAVDYLDPPQVPVQIPFRDIEMPGYLRLPHNANNPPLVVLLGGLDTTKEEQLIISNACVARGLATLTFDGPGQGETFYRMKLSSDFPEALSAVFDYAETIEEIDKDRLGIIGRSMGGHYAPRAAAYDNRIKAAVAWGAMYHLRNYASVPEVTKRGFQYVTGVKSLEDAKPYFQSVELDGIASQITCPLMIVHGGLDRITPTENAEMMRDAVSGPTRLLYWPDSYHCVHDRAHIVRPAMADFMVEHLTA